MSPGQDPSPRMPSPQQGAAAPKACAPVKAEHVVCASQPPASSGLSTQHFSTPQPSLLMASAWQRLIGATGLLVVLWGLVAWALGA